MKYFHNVQVTVFAQPSEKETLQKTLLGLAPIDPKKEKKEKIVCKQETALGFNKEKIIILKIFLEKQRHIKAFLEDLLNHLSDQQKKVIKEQTESRIDEDLYFFIRLDKSKLLKGVYALTDKGNCFHLKMSVAAFPKKRPIARALIHKIFK